MPVTFFYKSREKFYEKIILKRIKDRSSRILVCGGGVTDYDVFMNLGYRNVTITNLDGRQVESDFFPLKWKFENIECLSFENNSFDYVVAHATIHHTSLPHKALTEMYRVSKCGVLAFESRDSIVMKIMEFLGLTETYEIAAVFYNNCKFGGLNNSSIPNFIYRWTEREVEKTIQTYAPYFKHTYRYDYATAIPALVTYNKKSYLKKIFVFLLLPMFILLKIIFYKQQNLFAFFISKDSNKKIFPWLKFNQNGNIYTFNEKWAKDFFST